MDGQTEAPAAETSLRELGLQITELAGHLNAANRRFLALIAEFDRRKGWSDGATHSCAHWLNWQCGIDLATAREKLRVAHAVELLPSIGASMARGELSYSKVRALTRVACPATEDALLSIALHGTAHHVETIVRQFRRVRETEELSRVQRQYQRRRVSYLYDDDGSLVMRVRLPAEAGAQLLKALDAAVEAMPPLDVSAETSVQETPTWGMRRVDALAAIAESFLKHGAEALNGGERQQIVVHVDAVSLQNRATGRCEIEDGPAIAVETARRLSCDASLLSIVEDERGEPLNVGRKTRSIPPALRRALNSRDRGCRFPGCTHTRFVDGHHVRHWADGGETSLANLVTLCRFHHRKVHEGGIVVQRLDDGAWRFYKPSGECFETVRAGQTQPRRFWVDLRDCNASNGFRIDAHTAETRWRGERMDNSLAMEILWQRANRETMQNRTEQVLQRLQAQEARLAGQELWEGRQSNQPGESLTKRFS